MSPRDRRHTSVRFPVLVALTVVFAFAPARASLCSADVESEALGVRSSSVAAALALAPSAVRSQADSGSAVATSPGTPVKPKPTIKPAPKPKPVDRSWMRRHYGRRVHRIVTARKAVALTFDDGPTRLTKRTVQILDRYGAKGTFFVTGYCSRSAGAAAVNRYTAAHGHELANHTEHHKGLRRDRVRCLDEILSLERLLKQQTGKGTTWVRAMGGNIDRVGLRATAQTGHLYAQWSTDSWDAKRLYTPPYLIYGSVVNHVRPGSIVLIHVTHAESISALPYICRTLKARGYKMVTLSELAKMGGPYP